MHDIKQIRENRDDFVAGLARRAAAFDGKTPDKVAASILDLDNRWRAAKSAFEQHRARQNEASRAIGQAKAKKDEAGAAALLAEVAGLKEAMQKDEAGERKAEEELKKSNGGFAESSGGGHSGRPGRSIQQVKSKARKFGAPPN